MRNVFTPMLAATLSVALSAPIAAAAPAKSKRPATEAPRPGDPVQANAELQVAEAAIRAGQFEAALAALNRAASHDPNLDTIYLRRSGVLERLAGPAATWAQLRAASPSPQFRAIAEQLFYAAADAELYIKLANPDPQKRGRIEARISELRQRQRRAEELAATPPKPVPTPPPVVTRPMTPTPVPSPAPAPPVVTEPAPPPPVATRPATPPPVASPQSVSPWDEPSSVDGSPPSDASSRDAEDVPLAVSSANAGEAVTAATPTPTPAVVAPAPRVEVEARCEESAPPGPGLRIGGALATSLGVGMFGVGLAGTALGRRAETEYESSPDIDARERADARGKTMNQLTIVGFVAAAVLIGTGATMLGIDAKRRKRIRMAPEVSASNWGLVLQGRF
ncbi:MAG: hypothetical protein IPO88_00575 [Nannocystis sp.]|uniref:hypothetical protein n=1 Tax=Nannocystis sp. TaxID=1962667 RepID=UPI002426DCEA|nr:hypothetical protein [Nannocystis sp.]MBK9751998.1 hypothetical protein [Nannocystis sp.]